MAIVIPNARIGKTTGAPTRPANNRKPPRKVMKRKGKVLAGLINSTTAA